MNCPVCKKELIKFDDLVLKCKSDSVHHYSCLVHGDKLEFELIKLHISKKHAFGLEINHSQKSTQITKIEAMHKLGDEIVSEFTLPFYHESGVMEFDFSDIPGLIQRIELLETFS